MYIYIYTHILNIINTYYTLAYILGVYIYICIYIYIYTHTLLGTLYINNNECCFHWPVALTLRTSVNIDIRGRGGVRH